MGVYALYNRAGDAVYVGSSVDVNTRIMHHRMQLRGRRHANRRLQADWLADGEASFTYHLLEEVTAPARLVHAEQVWLDAYARRKPGRCYNPARPASRAHCATIPRPAFPNSWYQNGPVLYQMTVL